MDCVLRIFSASACVDTFALRARKIKLPAMPEIGKLLVVVGLGIVLIGALLWSGVGKGWLGPLPGDINYSKGNFSLHFPIVTCIVLSILVTLLLRLFRK
jgi:hypothetical protein